MDDAITLELRAQLQELKLQLNRIENEIGSNSSTQVGLKNLPSDDLVKWLKDNPFEEYETEFNGMKPITYGMRRRMEKVRYGKLGLDLTTTQRGIIKTLTEKNPDYGNRYNATDYFPGQGLSINAIMQKLYNV
tara:strand:+ start:902 stop:1300 length:399 start_codon:yes stop_codon:yes gene_type:complete